MKKQFAWLKTFFSTKELWVLGISAIISGMILSSIWWLSPLEQGVNPYQLLAYNIDVRDEEGTRLDPFYTIFFSNYEAKAPLEEKQMVTNILTEEVQRLHRYGDRHHSFLIDPLDDQSGLLTNLKVLNASHGMNQWLHVDQTFYDLLLEAQTMSLLTDGAFNMFIGTISDFWDELLDNPYYRIHYRDLDPAYQPLQRLTLESKMQFIPISSADIQSTLEFQIDEGQPMVRFQSFNQSPAGSIKITLGGIAKGFANDVMADRLASENLTRGYLSNGTSSITTLGPRYGNVPYRWQVTSPHPSATYAFTIEKTGRHSLSTSGAYNGFYMPLGSQEVLRHHIINPLTGYPSQEAIELNVISSSYPAGRLDALSTAMMVMTKIEAMAFRNTIVATGEDLEIAWIEVIDDRVVVTTTPGYTSIMIKERDVRYLTMNA
jgi:thiamine biosynthesis lipoprotein ApbE